MKVTGSSNNEVVTVQFSGNSFNYLNNGYTASQFKILYQFTSSGTLPTNTSWRIIDLLSELSSVNDLKTGHTFTLTQTKLNTYSTYSNILTTFSNTSGTTFGTVNLVRSSDIEEMSFDLNLPNGVFDKSQNPTYTTGNPTMTEVALLNNNKETLVMGKLASPIQRLGSQIVSVKIDF
jgi:hypothetical protein